MWITLWLATNPGLLVRRYEASQKRTFSRSESRHTLTILTILVIIATIKKSHAWRRGQSRDSCERTFDARDSGCGTRIVKVLIRGPLERDCDRLLTWLQGALRRARAREARLRSRPVQTRTVLLRCSVAGFFKCNLKLILENFIVRGRLKSYRFTRRADGELLEHH